MVQTDIEKKTSLWLGLLVLVMSIVYVLVTLGKAVWIEWIAVIWGLFLGGFLLLESGVISYFRSKAYKSLGIGDFVVMFTVFFGVVILINTALLIGTLQASAPAWLSSFATSMGVTAGVGGGILAIIHIISPRFK